MADASQLIGDIGGTNARFALADANGPGFSQEQTLQCADFPSVEAAIQHYLDDIGARGPEVICLAAALAGIDRRDASIYRSCFTDEECQDGIFCNGFELCVAGACQLEVPDIVCDELAFFVALAKIMETQERRRRR